MAEDIKERIYTIPLRRSKRAPRPKRAPTAIREVKAFVTKHMKPENDKGEIIKDYRLASKRNILDQAEKKVFIDEDVNRFIWKRGIENPPSKIRVNVIKTEEGVVEVSLAEESV